MKTEIEKLDQNIKCVENNILHQDEILSKLIELEDRYHRSNLHIDGIKETSNETSNLCK